MRSIMKRNRYAPALCAFALSTLALPAFAVTQDTYHFRGQTVHAEWTSFDGCRGTYLSVSGVENRTHDGPGSPTSGGVIEATVVVYDECTSSELIVAFGTAPLPDASHLVSGGLQSAALQTTVQARDFLTGATVPIAIDLAWDGQGEVFREHFRSGYETQGLRYHSSSAVSSRSATVTGDVSIHGVSVIPASADLYAFLGNTQSGRTSIIH
jgi:hypothetical protein